MKIIIWIFGIEIGLILLWYGYYLIIDFWDALKSFHIRRHRTWWMKNG